MPKVHFVKKAMKDNPVVKKGQPYYHWSFFRGPTVYSATPPRQSQLTQSDKLSRAYIASEQIQDIQLSMPSNKEELETLIEDTKTTLEGLAQDIRDIAEEYGTSADNIRESFSESPTADDCEEKRDSLESWADTVDQAVSTLEQLEVDDMESAFSELESAVSECNDCPV